MSAHVSPTGYTLVGAASKDGVKVVAGTFTGSAAYDAGGSLLPLYTAGLFGTSGALRYLHVEAQGTTAYHCNYVPGASSGVNLGKVAVFTAAGVQVTGADIAAVTFNFIAIGDDA
jgi:hypothetical protein